jgi:hypothetical protein
VNPDVLNARRLPALLTSFRSASATWPFWWRPGSFGCWAAGRVPDSEGECLVREKRRAAA